MIVPPRAETGKTDDAVLLRRFANDRSEAAFAELVRRHVDLVHSAALRRCGEDAHLAKDVVQQVFVALAQHAGKLADHPALSAWLFTATRNAALNQLVGEQRRRARETAAMKDCLLAESAPDAAPRWEEVRPVLDAAMDELTEADRTAVLLRFFERRSFAEIGATLQLTENAARMRTERALEKLRARLAARGIKSMGAAFGSVLIAHAVAPAPVGLAAVAIGAALGTGSAVGLWALLRALQLLAKSALFWSASATVVVAVLGLVHLPRGNRGNASAPVSAVAAPAEVGASEATGKGFGDPALAWADMSGAVSVSPAAKNPGMLATKSSPAIGADVWLGAKPTTAEETLQAMAAAYRRLSSYRDQGVLIEWAESSKPRERVLFSTYFSRPKRWRFDWTATHSRGLELTAPKTWGVRFDGKIGGYFVPDSRGGVQLAQWGWPEVSSTFVIAFAESRGADFDIPALLADDIGGVSLANLVSPRLIAGARFEDTDCYQLEGSHRFGDRYVLLIGEQDFLIRRILVFSARSRAAWSKPEWPVDAVHAGVMRTLEEIHRNIVVNGDRPPETFEVKPPTR